MASCQVTSRSMKMTPSRANIEPIARSMPPVMMTKPSPIENRPNRPIRLAVLPRLIGDRKRGFRMATTSAHHDDQQEEAEILLQHVTASASCRSCRPTASRITFSSLNSGASRKPAMRAFAHHHDAVADADHLLHVARDHQDGDAGIGQPAHQAVDLRLRADIDAARRLVEDHDLRASSTATSPAPPSAGCRPTGCRPACRSRPSGCRARRCARSRCGARRRCGSAGAEAKAARLASEMFSVTENSSTRPERLRSSGTRKMPWSMASRGVRMAIVRPSRRSFAADRAVDAEDGAGELGAAGADQARHAEDLAAVQGKIDRVRRHSAAVRRPAISSTAPPGGRSARDIERFQVAADHHADHGVVPDRAAAPARRRRRRRAAPRPGRRSARPRSGDAR